MTKARLGTVQLKPGPPTNLVSETPAKFYGNNVLPDSGSFESWVESVATLDAPDRLAETGFSTNIIPYSNNACDHGAYWRDGTDACLVHSSAWIQWGTWQVARSPFQSATWYVSTWDPRSGYWSALWPAWYNEVTTQPSPLSAQGRHFIPATMSARVDPGDTVDWSAYVKVAWDKGTPQVVLALTFFTSALNPITTITSTHNLTEAYAQYSLASGVPSGSTYVRAWFDWDGGSVEARSYVAVDDAALGVFPP